MPEDRPVDSEPIQVALDLLRKLTVGTPYYESVWLVGGYVRDQYLGRPVKTDVDLVTTLPVTPLIQLLEPHADHLPVVYERFGTAMVHLGGVQFEFVTARRESYRGDSRKPDVTPASLEEDASRRDFTVNALFENLHTGTLIDPTGRGLEDLRARVLRTPKDPNKTFYDDPLRMLRAVRFRWQFEFEPAENLYPAVQQNASRLSVISAERYRDEFNKILLLPLASKALADLMNLGLFDQLIPELMAMKGVDQGNFHHLDVWNHSLLVVENLKNTPDLLLKLAGLFHDVGKPATRSVDESGKIRFFNHEVIGEELTQSILRRLKYSGDEIATVARLVRNHMRLGSAPVFTSSAARRVWRDMGDDVPRLLALVDADSHALKPGVRSFDLGPIEAQLEQVKRVTPVSDLESPLTGQEIMSILELAPGPEIGRAKKFLLEHVLEGSLKIGDRKESERLLREDYHRERQTKDWQA